MVHPLLLLQSLAIVASLPGLDQPKHSHHKRGLQDNIDAQAASSPNLIVTHALLDKREDKAKTHGGQMGTPDKHLNTNIRSSVSPSSAGLEAGGACHITDMVSVGKCKSSKNVVIGDMTVPAHTTLAINLVAEATLTISGTIKFGVTKGPGPLMSISGQHALIQGKGVIDGNGPAYWANKQDNGQKPDLLHLHELDFSTVKDITIRNSPIQAVSILAKHLRIIDVTIDNSAGTAAGAKNTDGYDIGGSEYIEIIGGRITTQDDAVAINTGMHIHVSGVEAHGTHGYSISVSTGNVQNVTVKDCIATGGENGLRIKTRPNGHGSISDVTWEGNRLNGIQNDAIAILQNYNGEGASGSPGPGVAIRNVHVIGNTGSSSENALHVECAACSAFQFSKLGVTGVKKIAGVSLPGL